MIRMTPLAYSLYIGVAFLAGLLIGWLAWA